MYSYKTRVMSKKCTNVSLTTKLACKAQCCSAVVVSIFPWEKYSREPRLLGAQFGNSTK